MEFEDYKREVMDKTPFCDGAKYKLMNSDVGVYDFR